LKEYIAKTISVYPNAFNSTNCIDLFMILIYHLFLSYHHIYYIRTGMLGVHSMQPIKQKIAEFAMGTKK